MTSDEDPADHDSADGPAADVTARTLARLEQIARLLGRRTEDFFGPAEHRGQSEVRKRPPGSRGAER